MTCIPDVKPFQLSMRKCLTNIVFNKRPIICIFNSSVQVAAIALLLVAIGDGVVYGYEVDEVLPISADQTQVLMEKAAALDAQIQRRQQIQQENAALPEDSKEYQAGYSDGYNKAILDLVKAKLLNDPLLSPKPMGSGLQQATYNKSVVTEAELNRSQLQQRNQVVLNPPIQNASGQTLQNSDASQLQTPGVSETPPTTNLDSPFSHINNNTSLNSVPNENLAGTATTATSAAATTVEAIAETTTETTVTTTRAATAVVVTNPVATSTEDANSVAAIDNAKTIPTVTNPAVSKAPPPQTISPAVNAAPRQSAQNWLQQSNSYLMVKNWQQAINAATTAMALDAGLVDSYIVRSWAYAENGQTHQALDDIAAAIRLDPDNALAYNNRAYVYELANNRDKAQDSYQKACDLNYQPACATAQKLKQIIAEEQKAKIGELTNLSYQKFQQKDWKGVVQTTTELLRMDVENSTALVNRAGAYTEMGLYNKALDDCNSALIIDPNMSIAYNNKGYVLELMGQPRKAAMEYETACVLGLQQSCGDFKRLSHKVSSR